ncbi:MAG TPA: tyrosine-type recombinase/integrase [Pseudonocardia sp.]|nr:tyrosine-type recombinase/integrase [Pseudonocardia sp.]
MPEIKLVTLPGGRKRYRFVVDVGRDPATGRRQQKTHTFDTKREARDELARITHQRRTGEYVLPTYLTVDRGLDLLLPALCVDVEPATAANYTNALRPVRVRLGARRLQSLHEQDVDDLVQWMLTSGRVRGGKVGSGLGIRSVELTLGQLRAVLNEALRRKMVVRNVAAFTKIPRAARKQAAAARSERAPWSEAEVRAFLLGIRDERLFAPLMLSLLGMRPAEVCGLRWSDVDLVAGTLTVANTRTLVAGAMVEKGPKSEKGMRVLPMPASVTSALRAFRKQQAAERLSAGPGYTETGYVLVDELGLPWRTDQLRRVAYALMKQTGIRRVRLYDARHACLTFLATSGVPDVVVSAWAGHADLAFTKRTYVHPNAEHLREASDALARLLG